jgi:amidohydrolase
MISAVPELPSVNAAKIRLDIRSLEPQLVQWRRYLHQRPELGFKEWETAAFIAQQ